MKRPKRLSLKFRRLIGLYNSKRTPKCELNTIKNLMSIREINRQMILKAKGPRVELDKTIVTSQDKTLIERTSFTKKQLNGLI